MTATVHAPRVSVVTIFLDEERFLAEAIASVLAQTFRDFELLLVDDGSHDGSTAIARDYAAAHPDRVRYLEHPGHANLGASAARNLGIRNARGDYVAFIDADDVWYPDTLARAVAALDARPAVGMAFGLTEYWYGWTGDPADVARDHDDARIASGLPADGVVPPPAFVRRLLDRRGLVPCVCATIARRDALERVGGYEDTFRAAYEDQVLIAKMALTTPVAVVAERWARYRQHPASMCARDASAHREAETRAVFLLWLTHHLADRGIRDAALERALARACWLVRHPAVNGLTRRLSVLQNRVASWVDSAPGRALRRSAGSSTHR